MDMNTDTLTSNDAARATLSPARQLRLDAELTGLLAALIVLCLLAALFAPNFATAGNLLDVLRQVAFTGIIAYGMTLVIVAGEIDVSVGSAIAFSSALFGTLTVSLHLTSWSAALAVVALGAAIGAGAGALAGTAYGANGSQYEQGGIQRQYDIAYTQCMYSRGNQVPGYRGAPRGYAPPAAQGYGPPPGY